MLLPNPKDLLVALAMLVVAATLIVWGISVAEASEVITIDEANPRSIISLYERFPLIDVNGMPLVPLGFEDVADVAKDDASAPSIDEIKANAQIECEYWAGVRGLSGPVTAVGLFFNMAGRPVQTLCSWPVPAEVAASILVDHIQRTSGRAARYLRKEGTVHFIQLDPPPGTDA